MGILSDLAAAYVAYPHEYLTLEIVEVDPPGSAVNTNEDVLFRIQVANTGPLDVNDLQILVEGLNGTLVKNNNAIAPWTGSLTTSVGQFDDVPGHSGNNPKVSTGGKLHFKPVITTSAVTDLVRVSVAGWNTDSSHIENGHTRADADANAVYSSTVPVA